ncbi:Zinc finger protein GLIS3 [Frankliniella fusca]|uniref:Zinc finger protein GLIS3 n=1 Tax=Frankliniella fusca TaxID=407009 RepID=A0AAE1LGN6_9NEOP|nr:Zinc finger protein GLIS3 [Frankliniella fusca]
MLLDSRHFAPVGCQSIASVVSAVGPEFPSAAAAEGDRFQVMYLRGGGMSLDAAVPELDVGGRLDAMDAMDTPLLELGAPLDSQLDNKSLFVDAFQYWRQDVDADFSSSSIVEEDRVHQREDVKPEILPGGLPHMIPGSRRFAAAPAPEQPPQSILLHTGANVVDMVSGVTCSGVGLGALGAPSNDVIGDHIRPSNTSLSYRPEPRGQHQGNFGHLLRQRPASFGGELYSSSAASFNQVVTRQRPHSEDLQGLSDMRAAHANVDDEEGEEDDDEDDDVFLASNVYTSAPQAHRQRLSSSGNSNEDASDEDDAREEGVSVSECRWSECGLQFPGRAPLVRHIEKVHVEPRRGEDFSCLWQCCPRGARPFNARYKLLIHMRVHSGEKPNKCPFPGCPKAFSRLENLKIHQRSHTGERPYCCQFSGCNKAFSNSSDRAKHQRTHFDTKPYACQVPGCSKRYTDPSSLRKHVKNHSGKDHAHASAHASVRRAGSTADSEGSTSSEPSQSSEAASDTQSYSDSYDALFPSADDIDIDQAIREFIPFDEVGKLLAEPSGVGGFGMQDPLELDFDTSFWNCPA